ncbi:MAG TPA: DUF3634 family protein [Planctomycetaceae bacterium]|jgi:hypothetical protein|nr:DUF3634 family protein [Planctomycetaceae bacterium]
MRELVELLILALAVGGAWMAFSPKPVFKIRVAKGSVRVTRGKVTADFQQQAREIFDQWRISRGWFAGVRRGKRLTLVFSHTVPPGCRQQLRNLWTNY